jgi:dTDP-4-amino-4,6-dideoxygalactose transaminase
LGRGYNDGEHAAWMFAVIVEDREKVMKKLRENIIESEQVHHRNDSYSTLVEG